MIGHLHDLRARLAATRRPGAPRDEGSTLILALLFILIGSLVIVPLLDYAMGVTRSSRVLTEKTARVEAVKGGLRVALADPVELYKVCDAAGITVGVRLTSPGLDESVTTTCFKMDETTSEDPVNIRYGLVSTQVGSVVPDGLQGNPFPGNGGSPETAWRSAISTVNAGNTIWLPTLPSHGLNRRSAAGYAMPAGYPACRVFFPGTYLDPITITDGTPVYFTSGIYYFEKAVRISGSARVVAGGGGTEGCTSDQEAAFQAVGAPATHNISGLGVTFVFGAEGRLVIDTATTGTGPSFVMNQRYVAPTDAATAPSAGVSIVSVNGSIVNGVYGDLNVPGMLNVPYSMVTGSPEQPATAQEYRPSTLVPNVPPPFGTTTTTSTTTAAPTTTTLAPTTTVAPTTTTSTTSTTTTTTLPPAPVLPIVDLAFTNATPVTVVIPGYIAVPQGIVRINATGTGAEQAKDIQIMGGILAADIQISGARPQSLTAGLVNPVVQKTFKIVSTSADSPQVTSIAIVQVNQNGAYAVNSWAVQ